ncbi:MAG: hypothetical protein U1G07_19610 [Verrucomicrobiota bacterium]
MTDPGPSQTWVFIDEREDSINDGCFFVDMAGFDDNGEQDRIVDFPGSYHNHGASFSFADGHSQLKRWRDARTAPALQRHQNLASDIASAFNLDVGWLQEHSTRR